MSQGVALISIHAPARGATCSTPPKLPIDHISIHAPARGATCSVNSDSATFSNFNPRSREGSDYAECLILLMFHVFQSTLPRGERRHYRKQTYKILCDFNPRSREGSDVLPPLYVEGGYYISIHAPARGATFLRMSAPQLTIFQSTLPRGERPTLPPFLPCSSNFNPRSREGSDFFFQNLNHVLF